MVDIYYYELMKVILGNFILLNIWSVVRNKMLSPPL